MLWNTIKKILQKQGGTCIIIEDGKPSYVVNVFEEYQRLLGEEQPAADKTTGNISEQGLLERINQEIENWKVSQAEEQATGAIGESGEEVKIEDLPL